MSRTAKLTQTIQAAIVNAVEAGVPFTRACLLASVGVSANRLYGFERFKALRRF
jgi:hypothetical protein